MNELRGCHLDIYTPIFDHIGLIGPTLAQIFWLPYTKFPRSHISCSRKKVKHK